MLAEVRILRSMSRLGLIGILTPGYVREADEPALLIYTDYLLPFFDAGRHGWLCLLVTCNNALNFTLCVGLRITRGNDCCFPI